LTSLPQLVNIQLGRFTKCKANTVQAPCSYE
jgi:hypothetical protein